MQTSLARTLSIALRVSVISTLVLAITIIAPAQGAAAAGAANDHTVLILGPTVTGGAASREAVAAIAIGMDVEVATAAQWAAKTTADFATYRALILGDPTCTAIGPAAAAVANTSTWGPAVNGRVLINGTDPVYHQAAGRAEAGNLTRGGVQFAASEATRTGAYISLSCYYHDTPEHTPVPLLDAFAVGGFSVRGVGCFNDAHIVATSPALATVTDASLSNWSCSVHEAFDMWPAAQFDVLAIARGIGSTFTASDGSVGTPYILARGATVISDITLAPATGSAPTGTTYTLTATVHEGGSPTAGRVVTFNAIGGPNNGMMLTGIAPTSASGQATASYSSALVGTDTWVAHFTDSASHVQTSNRVTVDWTKPVGPVLHSLAVDGSTGYAEASDAPKLNPTNWTIEAWFKDQTPGGYNHAFQKIVAKADETVSSEAPYFLIIGNNELRAGIQHDYEYKFTSFSLASTTANAWHHAAATLDATTNTVTLYLDGVQVAQSVLFELSSGNTVPVSIGRGGNAGYYFNGKIDDVRLWSVVRTPAEIASNYSAEFSAPPAGLVANWKFDEATGTTAADSTAAPADASLNGGATFSTDVHP